MPRSGRIVGLNRIGGWNADRRVGALLSPACWARSVVSSSVLTCGRGIPSVWPLVERFGFRGAGLSPGARVVPMW